MNSLIPAITIFLVAFTLHILIHRILFLINIKSLKSLVIYVVGFLLIPVVPYQSSSRVLYVLLSLLASIFYLTPFLGGETPTSMILNALHSKKQMKKGEILSLFSDDGLIHKRVRDLVKSGLLIKNKNILMLSPQGNFIIHAILMYQKIFNRVLTG